MRPLSSPFVAMVVEPAVNPGIAPSPFSSTIIIRVYSIGVRSLPAGEFLLSICEFFEKMSV